MKLNFILALLALTACSAEDQIASSPPSQEAAHKIFLVRHAEKQAGDNPSLTAAGELRAATLAEIMSKKGLTHIHSTNYKRTLETAAPIAQLSGVEIQLYDPSKLDAFADDLRSTVGVHLVVGHSNTTPDLALALGGDPGDSIDEKNEYDRLYVIDLDPDGPSSSIERFGDRYQKETKADQD